MANTPGKPQMSDDDRADLMAMIAAGRELSPEMDKSLVDSYAERHAAEQQAQAKVQGNAIVSQQSGIAGAFSGVHPAVAIAGMAMLVAIFTVIMLFSGGHGWWMIFPLFGICGGWWGNHDRHRLRDERRAERYQMRADYFRARMGQPARDDGRRLPESTGDSGPLPPPIGVPTQSPPANYSAPPASASPSAGNLPPINPAG